MTRTLVLFLFALLAPRPALASNIVFVTSGNYDGNLGGIVGGDAICNTLASAAGLPGSYVAWLSDGLTDARDRLTPGGGPYVSVTGFLIANDLADLTDGYVGAISRDETNHNPTGDYVWTGTNSDGTWNGVDCQGWTSNANGGSVRGRAGLKGSNSTWTSRLDLVCFSSRHLYCFQQ